MRKAERNWDGVNSLVARSVKAKRPDVTLRCPETSHCSPRFVVSRCKQHQQHLASSLELEQFRTSRSAPEARETPAVAAPVATPLLFQVLPSGYNKHILTLDYTILYIHTYMHTCIHAYMHTCIHAYMHTCIHAYMHTCIHAYMHTCIHAYMHTCIHAHMHTCTHAHMHTCTHTHIHTYIHISYTHTYIHTYIFHIHICTLKVS